MNEVGRGCECGEKFPRKSTARVHTLVRASTLYTRVCARASVRVEDNRAQSKEFFRIPFNARARILCV